MHSLFCLYKKDYRFLGILDVPNEFIDNNVVIEPREGVAVEYLPVQGKIA